MGKRVAAYYAFSLLVVAIVAGLFIDGVLFSNYEFKAVEREGRIRVQQCCVPLVFGEEQATDWKTTLKSVPVWHYPFVVVLAVTLIFGGVRHVWRVAVEPCTFCQFWRDGLEDAGCPRGCWLKRLHTAIFRRGRARAGAGEGGSEGGEGVGS
jgi:hypothetical protein